jgi:predicted membrane GTPase involved in stress response
MLDKHFEMLVSNLDYSDYLGRIAYGKIYRRQGQSRRQDRLYS